MRDIATKANNTGDILSALTFDANFIEEYQRVVESCDFTLDPELGPDTDLHMLAKSIVIYGSAGNFYDDTGSVNTFVLDRANNLEPFPSYFDGMIVVFKALNNNTGACTINIDSLGAKDLTDNGGVALSSGDISSNDYVTARYNGTADRFEMIVAPSGGGGGSLTTWSNTGDDLLPNVSGTGTLGDATHLVEALYLGDNCQLFLGDGQDTELYYDGSDTYLDMTAGDLYVTGGGLTLDNGEYFNGTETGATVRSLLGLDGSDICQIGNTNNATNIQSDGTLTHNTVDLITDLLPAQATHANEFLQTDGAGTISWAAASLLSWEENSDDLRPVVSGTGNLGDATHLIEGAYFGDSAVAYFGNDQDLEIYHDGSNGYIDNTTGYLNISVASSQRIAFLVNGVTFWEIYNTGPIIPGASNPNKNIGGLSSRLDYVYCTDVYTDDVEIQTGGKIHFHSDDFMYMYHDGTDGYIENTMGAVKFLTTAVEIDNNLFYSAEETDTTVRSILGIDGSDIVNVGNVNNALDIVSNGTLTHNGTDLITDLLPAQGGHSGEQLQTDGAGTLSWAAAGTTLSSWEENSDDLRPVVSGTGSLGQASYLIEGAYFDDNAVVNLGAGQDLQLYHDATDSYIDNATGDLYLRTTASNVVYFSTNGTNRWQINASGNLLPEGGVKNIGSSSLEIGHIYHADTYRSYYGSDQDMYVVHDGANGLITNATGMLTLETTSASQLRFRTNSTDRFDIDSSGHLIPQTTNTYDIGATASRLRKLWSVDGEFTNLPTISGGALITAALPAQATHSGEFLQTDGAGTLSWAAAGGTTLSSWEENSDDFRPIVSGTGNLGDATHLVEGAYFGDSATIFMGTDQDLEIYHDGTNAYIDNGTGALKIINTAVEIDNNVFYSAQQVDTTVRSILGIDGSDIVKAGNVNNALDIVSNGTLTHNSTDLITDLLPAQATHANEFLQTDGAGTLSWAAPTGTLSSWEENSDDLRPVVSGTGSLGQASYLIEGAYFDDNAIINLGASQDFQLYHDGTDSYIDNGTGDLYLRTTAAAGIFFSINSADIWEIDTSGHLIPQTTNTYDIGATASRLRKLWSVDGEFTNLPTISGGALITAALPAQATHANEFLQTDGAGTLSWAAPTGTLSSWEENSDDLRPVVSGTGNLGDSTHLIEGAYFNDNAGAYFGAGQDLEIYHDGTDSWVRSHLSTADLYVGNFYPKSLIFFTNSIDQWAIDGSGYFVPQADGTKDIGSTSLGTRHVYTADNGHHYFGSDQDMEIYHTGTNGYVQSSAGIFRIGTTDSNDVYIITNSSPRWTIGGSAGHLLPSSADTYDIGSSSLGVNDFYQGDSGTHYFGSDQDMSIYHDGTDGYIVNGTGELKIESTTIRTVGASTAEIEITLGARPIVNLFRNDNDITTGEQIGQFKFSGGDPSGEHTAAAIIISATDDWDTDYYPTKIDFYTSNSSTVSIGLTIDEDGNVIIPNDNANLQIGAGQDLELYHDGTDSYIDNNTGILNLTSTLIDVSGILATDKLYLAQGAPIAQTTDDTLTAAELDAGIITVNQGSSGTSSQTLPTASDMDTYFSSASNDYGFEFSVINISTTAAEDCTVVTNTGWTLVGSMVIEAFDADRARSSGKFFARKTGSAAWTLYRIA